MENIYQLKITLRHTRPPIWRRVLVHSSTTFEKLHHIIQIAMDWTNSHLYEFSVKGLRISEPDEAFDSEYGIEPVDPSAFTIDSIISNVDDKFMYTYDFGDNWEHEILLEKILAPDKKKQYPICTGGKLSGPPEDCGGIPGFYHLLEILNTPGHPERKEMLEWLDGSFHPGYFDIDDINEQLSKIDK